MDGDLKRSSDLRPSERAFMHAMHLLQFGRYESLQVLCGELTLDESLRCVSHVKFGAKQAEGLRSGEEDFELKSQAIEFFAYVRSLQCGQIRNLEVRHGLPFAMEIELAASDLTSDTGVPT